MQRFRRAASGGKFRDAVVQASACSVTTNGKVPGLGLGRRGPPEDAEQKRQQQAAKDGEDTTVLGMRSLRDGVEAQSSVQVCGRRCQRARRAAGRRAAGSMSAILRHCEPLELGPALPGHLDGCWPKIPRRSEKKSREDREDATAFRHGNTPIWVGVTIRAPCLRAFRRSEEQRQKQAGEYSEDSARLFWHLFRLLFGRRFASAENTKQKRQEQASEYGKDVRLSGMRSPPIFGRAWCRPPSRPSAGVQKFRTEGPLAAQPISPGFHEVVRASRSSPSSRPCRMDHPAAGRRGRRARTPASRQGWQRCRRSEA